MKKKILIILLIFFIIIGAICIRTTISQYKSKQEIRSTMTIAKPIFKVEGNETTKISALNNIGYYEFKIKNFDEENMSDTGFLYYIEILSKTDDAIKFELYDEQEQLMDLENLKTNQFIMPCNEKLEKNYKLKVVYDKNNGEIGKVILEDIQIKVHSEQIKVGWY